MAKTDAKIRTGLSARSLQDAARAFVDDVVTVATGARTVGQ